MQYTWLINYKKCLEHWLNLSQWALMDSMLKLSSRASWIEVNGEIYYYLSMGKMVEILPVISDKKNTFRVIIKKLIDLWLLDRIIIWTKSYYKLSALWKLFDRTGEKNHKDRWKKSPLTGEKNHHNNSISNKRKKIKVKNTYNTDFPYGEIWNTDSDILSDWDTTPLLDYKNTNTSKSSPRWKKSPPDRDYFNEKNSEALLSAMCDLWAAWISKSSIKKNTRLMQALWWIKWDIDKIEEAISGIDFNDRDCLIHVADEIYRLHLNKYNN